MNRRRSRLAPSFSFALENLESRLVLSTVGAAGAVAQGSVQVAALSVKHASTQTSMTISAGTLGQPITFTITVKGPAASGPPQGTVSLSDHGQVLTNLTLSPSTSTGKSATSQASITLAAQAGGDAYFFGKHSIVATYHPTGAFAKSSVTKTFAVSQPTYTTLSDGVKVATIAPGSGPAVQSGQSVSVLYTGYLAKNGEVFDASLKDGGTPLVFTLGSGEVIPGYDAGTAGMQVGETRLILIPPSQGYGATVNGSIPANSTLLFVQTLVSAS